MYKQHKPFCSIVVYCFNRPGQMQIRRRPTQTHAHTHTQTHSLLYHFYHYKVEQSFPPPIPPPTHSFGTFPPITRTLCALVSHQISLSPTYHNISIQIPINPDFFPIFRCTLYIFRSLTSSSSLPQPFKSACLSSVLHKSSKYFRQHHFIHIFFLWNPSAH